MEKFTVDHDIPTVVVSFKISTQDVHEIWSDGGIVELNYKEMFKKLTGRKRNGNSSKSNPPLSSTVTATPLDPTLPTNGAAPPTMAPSNRFEMMISQLERKYLDLANYQNISDHEGSLTSNSTCTSPGINSDVATPSPVTKSTNKKKKKKIVEDYDYSDAFIDDTEALEEFEEAMRMKKMKTVHDGFFVSSGHLDIVKAPFVAKKLASVVSVPNESSSSSSKASMLSKKCEIFVPNKTGNNVIGEKIDEKEKDKRCNKQEKEKEKDLSSKKDKEKKDVKKFNQDSRDKEEKEKEKRPKTKKDKSSSNEIANTSVEDLMASSIPIVNNMTNTVIEPAPSTATLNQVNSQGNDNMVQEDSGDKKTKSPIEKPDWQPNEEVKSAMEAFKLNIERSGVTVNKKNSIFPKDWERPLLELDKIVFTHYSQKEISKTKGYYEFLESIFGSQFKMGRIKTIIARLGFAGESSTVKEMLDVAVIKVFEDLKKAIVLCPENKQPGNKPPRKSKGSTIDAENVDDGVDAIDLVEIASPTKSSVDHVVIIDGDGACNNAISVSMNNVEQSVESTTCLQIPQNGKNSNLIGEATIKDELVVTPVKYEWYCKWSIPLRQAFITIEDLTETWVKAENKYREKLTAIDKKDMHENDVSIFYTVSKFVIS